MSRHVRPYAVCDRCAGEEDVGKHGALPEFWVKVVVSNSVDKLMRDMCLDLCASCLGDMREWRRDGKSKEGYRGGRSGIEVLRGQSREA